MAPAAIEDKTRLKKQLDINMDLLAEKLAFDKNFDIVRREMIIGGRKIMMLFVDAFANAELMTEILGNLHQLEREELSVDAFQKLFLKHINYVEVQPTEYIEDLIEKMLSGPLALIVDGLDKAILLDVRTYPARSPQEPDLEKVVRGSRDGFTETLVFNTALIRRRIRDPKLRMEYVQAGNRSKTDIVICYIEDIANEDLVDSIREKIGAINIDGLPMAEKAVEELITPGNYWNPLPRVRYTERPDVAAIHLLEGHVLVLVDTSPSVIITPTTLFHHLQHAEEYRQNPTAGVFMRLVRYMGIFISVFLLPLWLLAVLQPGILPPALKFIGPDEIGKIPVFVQFLLAEVAVDMVRMATIHTPTALATAVGLIAALLIGDLAVTVGLFNAEVIMYTAAAVVGNYLTPSYELAFANRLIRLFLLVMVGFFRLPGLLIGLVLVMALLIFTRSFGVPYMWPLIPFNARALYNTIVRRPVPVSNVRPSILKTRDVDRQGVPVPARKPDKGNDKKDK
ncbi:spore germination protein [Desulfallas thermosapovorans]|uniref:Stage V sporulation protein AF n=1 Tax=Desulfallas thermosapovorans DSM 6562 TaxID=1121431 RepID=A0A5S4ZRP9_9FIRM|nr:spore germination protein [Desulfallas thermosapovorans]TYO95587.1 stage V sporulation protein AF [Desulfallas thermosapovorans DSM 6562]